MKTFGWFKKTKDSKTEEYFSLAEQQNALIDWASNTDMEPKWRKEILHQISKMDKVLEGKELDYFLEELARMKLGISITDEEIKNIMKLTQNVNKAKDDLENGGSQIAYEKAQIRRDKYIEKLKKE